MHNYPAPWCRRSAFLRHLITPPPSHQPQVFLRAGLKSPIVGSILVGAINLGFTLLAASLMDARGRKPLLQISFGGMAAALAAVAVTGMLPCERWLLSLALPRLPAACRWLRCCQLLLSPASRRQP